MKCLYPIAEHDVYQFVMPVIRSNMYIILHDKEALIIDPSINAEAECLLYDAHTSKCTVLLTHEHFDHTSGVNRLRSLFDCEVICTKVCGELITDPKKCGTAVFAALFLNKNADEQMEIKDLLDATYHCAADVVYEDEMTMDWQGFSIFMKEMPGHSKGSQIIHIDRKNIFTGDNLVPGAKTITRLPGGSNLIYQNYTLPYFRSLSVDSILYPGHGYPLFFSKCLELNSELYREGELS